MSRSEKKDNTPLVVVPNHEEPDFPSKLPVLLLSGQVVFPMSVVPMRVNSKEEVKLLDDAALADRFLAILARKTDEDAGGRRNGLDKAYEVGVVARILQLQHLPDGTMNVLVQALRRFRVAGVVQRTPYPIAEVEIIEPQEEDEEALAPLTATVRNQMLRLLELSPNVPEHASNVLENVDSPSFLADLVASNLNIALEEKQRLLETFDVAKRLKRLTFLLAHELEIMELSDKIQSDVKSSIDKSQREYFLRQQLQAIKEELGEGESGRPEIKEYRERIEALKLKGEVRKEALRELDRLSQMNEASAEYHVITTYLDWIVDLPWNESTDDILDVQRAEKVLNEDHYGLDRVKRRILEFLAVRKLKPDAHGPILCFVGPPGVGKTSLGKSIARTMGRRFVRMSLGGVRDEAEIRGHRKTYVGALPGRIIQSVKKAGSNNPVFMLDEIDKVGADFRGDPSSALLEVLDPAQNDSFQDHYLGVPFDLSSVMFIATGNILDTIPWALRDRMEIIEIPGYTQEEKLEIAKRYLVPRQLEANGLTKKRLKFTAAALRRIIGEYTREAGVRNLEREIGNVCRRCAAAFARGRRKAISVSKADIDEYLGHPKVEIELAERTSIPGVATGLSWTAFGGRILFIEATRMPGKGGYVLTGQLGDVMKESAQTVLSYVRANAERYGIDPQLFPESDIHLHVPAGAVPKDGPSAGVAILTAVMSLLTGKRVKSRLAMTGEISLRGLVLPVGGIKEKVLGAMRANVKEVILPKRNENDLEDVPEEAKKRIQFHFAERMDEVLELALGITPKD